MRAIWLSGVCGPVRGKCSEILNSTCGFIRMMFILAGIDNIRSFQTDGLVWLLTGDQIYKTILSIPNRKTKDERLLDYKSTQ